MTKTGVLRNSILNLNFPNSRFSLLFYFTPPPLPVQVPPIDLFEVPLNPELSQTQTGTSPFTRDRRESSTNNLLTYFRLTLQWIIPLVFPPGSGLFLLLFEHCV